MSSLSLGKLDPMPTLRANAVSKVNRLFNELARETLHDDLVALAAGKPDAINAREAARQHTVAAVAAATSPDALTAILSNIPTK